MADLRTATTVIGPDTLIKGDMVFDSDAQILGTFEGHISAKGQLHIGKGATCRADLDGEEVVVDGLFEGSIRASGRVLLNTGARVLGDIESPLLAVVDGAKLDGHCRIGAAEPVEPRASLNKVQFNGVEPRPASTAPARFGPRAS